MAALPPGFTLEKEDQTLAPSQDLTAPQSSLPAGFVLETSEPEVDDGRGLFSQMSKGFQGFEFGTVAPTIGLQAESGVVAKGRQYLGAYTQLEQGATAKDLALASEGALNLEQLQRYEEGTEEERQKLREFSETTSKKATTRTLDRLGALAESEARTREFAPAVAGITDVKSLADFRDWLGYSIGAGSKQILPIMSAGFVAGPSGALGVGTALAATETIGNRLNFIQDIVKDLPPDEQATAIAEYLEKTGDTTTIVALTSGSLDLAGPVGSLLKRRLTKDLGKEVVERTGLDILKGIPKELGKDMLEEGITGGLQETTQLAGKRATGEQTGDLITKENIKDIVDAAAAEAAGGIAGTSINVGADVLRQRAIKARRRNADQPRTRPEWTPVVSAYANMDMGKSEEEIYTRVGEVIADFGNEAATAYLSQVYGVEYTPTAEQEVEVLKGPGQIDSEPVELVSQVLDDVENSEWLADLDSEREATFQAAAELEEVGAEEVEAASIATVPADDMFGFDVPAATQDTGFEPTRNRLMAKLNQTGAQELDFMLREAGLQVTGAKEQKIERLIAAREAFDLLTENGEKKYESAVQISQAIQSGEINAEDAARLVNAISVGQKSRTSYVAADTNANALAALIGRLKPSLAVPFRTEAEEAAFQAGREPAPVVPGEEAATARAREDEFFENSRLEFLQFWEQATPSDRLELLQAAGAEGNTAGKTSRRVNAKTIDALPNESKVLLREWAPDNWNTFKNSPRTGTAVPTAKLGRPVGTGRQSDTAVELSKQQEKERKRLGRATTALAATLEVGEQKILDKRVARNKTIKFSDYFPTIEEFNQYTNNQRDAYDTEVKGLKLQYVTEGVAPEAAQTRAQVDANQKQIAANLLSDELQKLKAKRVKQLEKVIAIATDTKLEGKAAHTAALDVLNDPNIDPQERALAEDNVAATKAKQKPLGAIPAKTGPTPMFIGEKGVENLREQIEIYLLNPEGVVAPKIVPLDIARDFIKDIFDAEGRLTRYGITREALRRQTGWFEGIDGKWRIEISDEAGQFILPLDELVESPMFGIPTIYKLRDVYSHPLLYEIYPEAANIDFVYRPAFMDFLEQEQGSYNGKNQIQITPYAEDASSTLLHEIQHWVQQTEGFEEGGNEKSAANAILDTFEGEEIIGEIRTAIQAKLKKINAKQELFYKVVANIPDVISRIEGIEEKKKALRKFYGSPNWMDTEEGVALRVEEKAIKQEIKKVLDIPDTISMDPVWDRVEREVLIDLIGGNYKSKTEKLVEEQNILIEKLQKLDSNNKKELIEVIVKSGQAFDLYQRLAGEVEARNIQTRRLMTVEERLANLPEETEDIEGDDQIIVIAGNTLYPPATVTELLNVPETEGLATQEPLFGAIEEVETAAEAADTIIIDPNRTPFERGLARVLKPVLQRLGTTFVIVKDPAQITNPNIVEIWATVDGKQISAGVFDPTNNVIYVDEVEGLQPRVVLHEMIHAATVYTLRRYFNGEAISENAQAAIDSMIVIMDSVGQYYQTLVESGHNTPELDKYYENTDGFNDLEEFVTYGLTGPALQTMLLNMAPVSKPQLGYIRTAFSNFAEAIGRLIGRPAKEYSAFEELIDLTGRVAAETMRNPTKNAGKVVQAKAKVKKQNAAQKAQAKADTLRKFTNKSKGIVNATRNPEEGLAQFKAMFEAMGSKVKRASLAMLTGNMLTSLGDTYKIRAVRKVNNFIDRLKEFRNDKINKFLPNLDKWSVLTRDHKDTSETLEDVINLSTLFDVLIYDTDTKKLVSMAQSKLQDDGRDDVKTPEYPQGRPTGLKSIKFDLQQLSKNPNPDAAEQQEMDRLGKLFQEREAEIEEVFALFDKMKALGGGSTAVELYSWALQEYRNDFEEQYSLLLNSIRSDTTIEGTENDAASPKGKLMADIVASYQEARTRKVYAPLMRFGDWGVRVNPGSKDTAFYMFKNEAQQIQFMNFYQDQNPNDTVVAVSLNQEGRSFRDEMVADTERLRSMFNQIDALSQGNAEVADELKDSIYQIYLLTLPEGNMRKKYLRRKGRLGFDNDAFRALVTTKLSNINQLSRMKYGKDIRNAISEGREAIKDGPTKFQISRDPKKYKGEKPKESKEAILNEVALRATTELAPPVLKGWAAGFDRFTRLGTKSAFVWLMSAPSSALIQPTQLAMFGFGVLHAEFGAGKTAAMAAKYIKNFLTMQALTRTKVGENGNIENEKGQAAIRNSRYVNGSKIKVPLQKAWDIANLQNTFGASLTQDVLSLRDPEEIQARAERGPIARGVSRPVDFTVKMMTGATQLLERVSREVFFMSAFELAYEQALKAGATGDGAIEAAAYRAIKLTDKAMFDYSNQNKPRIAKTSVGRMAYQFQTYRIQATGYLIKNGYNAIFNSDLSPDEKRKAGVMFFDSLAMNAISGGLTATLGYTAFVALVDGIREALRPEYDDEDEDGMLYDMTDPNNPFGLRSFDLYVRGSFIPRYFGSGSSLAKLLGLEEENARLLARSVEVGPISALTDWNIQPRISFDAMWFTDYGQKPDLYSAAIEQSIFDIAVGPFGSVLKNMADGAQMMLEGEIYRGVEKMSPGFVKEPMEAYRLSQEGYVTVGGNRYAPADYYDAWRLTGQTLGFGSTELARSQKAIFAYQELKQEAKDNKTELYNAVEEAATRNLAIRTEYGPDSKQAARAKARLDDVLNDIRAHNYKYFYNAIKWEDLGASLQEKMRRAGLTKSGLYLGDAEAPYLYPLIQDMLLQPTMEEIERMKYTEDRDRNGEVITLPDVGTNELRE
jgi:hypothetical protein